MGSSQAGEALPSVLDRLQAREAQRTAEAAKRLEALQSSADPRESIEGFMAEFNKQRQALEASLHMLQETGAAPASQPTMVGSLAADVAELDKEVAAAAYYLPMYDLRQATLAIAALKDQLEAAKTALQPRKKFSFNRKAAKPADGEAGGAARVAALGAAVSPGGSGTNDSGEVTEHLQRLLLSNTPSSRTGRSLSGRKGQLILERRDSVAGLDFTLSDLQDCTVFLLGPLAALFLHRLQRCRVCVGPVAGATFMEDVQDSTLVLASRQDLRQQGLQEETGKWCEVHDFGWLRASKSPNWLLQLPLVCRAFHAVLSRGGLHWENVLLDGHKIGPAAAGQAEKFWTKLLAWCQSRGASVRRLTMTNFGPQLQLPCENKAVKLESLFGLLPGLQELTVIRSPAATSPEVLSRATCLTALRKLRVQLQGTLPTSTVGALACLPLESLNITLIRTIDGGSSFGGPFPAELTRLQTLKRLVLEGPYSGGNASRQVLPDGLSNWKQLTHLCLVNLGLEELPEAVGELESLEELCLGRNVLGPGHAGLPDSLTRLTRLKRLEVPFNKFEAGLPPVIGQLTSLDELNVAGNMFGALSSELPQGFSQLRRLRYLTLTSCGLTSLPTVVAGMSTLKLLKVNINRLQDLPAGPYLSSLEMIDMAHNRFAGYPAILAGPAAKRLEAVAFQHDGVHYTCPVLAAQLVTAAPLGAGEAGAVGALGAGPGLPLANPAAA
ncbi:hypothetical protein N2152v2_010424 [Parachlorella kessleri]